MYVNGRSFYQCLVTLLGVFLRSVPEIAGTDRPTHPVEILTGREDVVFVSGERMSALLRPLGIVQRRHSPIHNSH